MFKESFLILGSSSGFGAATAIELSKIGFNIIGVHLIEKRIYQNVENVLNKIKSNNVEVLFSI